MRAMLRGGLGRRLATLTVVAVTGATVAGVGLVEVSGAGAANAHRRPVTTAPARDRRCVPPPPPTTVPAANAKTRVATAARATDHRGRRGWGRDHWRHRHHPECGPSTTTTTVVTPTTVNEPTTTTILAVDPPTEPTTTTTEAPVTTTTEAPTTTTTVAPTTTTTTVHVQPCPGKIVGGVCVVVG